MDDLLIEEADGVATILLNRPDRLNAFSDPMVFGLIELLGELADRPTVGAVVITGAGRAFCAGGDVKAMAATDRIDVEGRIAALKRKHVLIQRLRSMPKIIIASINGAAVGAGLSLALACDIRIASRTARLGATYAKVALPGDYGISFLLAQAAGRPFAHELLLTGRILDADEALQHGLVSSVVDADALDAAVADAAAGFAHGPRLTYAAIKQMHYAADSAALASALDIEARAVIEAMSTADHREAVAAFTEKRPPRFVGR